MTEIRPDDIRYSYNRRGYMLFYKGKPIGGAGLSIGEKGCRANLKLFQHCAEVDKRQILSGYATRYIVEIEKILSQREANANDQE